MYFKADYIAAGCFSNFWGGPAEATKKFKKLCPAPM